MNNTFDWTRFCKVVRKDFNNIWRNAGTSLLIITLLPLGAWLFWWARYIASDYYLVAIGCMAVLVGTQWSEGLAGNSAGGALDFHRWCDISVHDGDTVAYAPYVQPAEGGYILCDVARVETGEVFEHVALLGGDMPVDLLPREHGARLFPDATAFRPVQKMAVADRLSGQRIGLLQIAGVGRCPQCGFRGNKGAYRGSYSGQGSALWFVVVPEHGGTVLVHQHNLQEA